MLLDGGRALFYGLGVAGNAKNPDESAGNAVPFEEALKRLEAIVESMEAGDLPLETLLDRFQEGTKLVKVCQGQLEQAELKIKQLEKNASGEMVLKNVQLEQQEQ